MNNKLSMRDHLQNHYNKLIKYADVNYAQSQEPMFAMLQRELLAKAEAFEAAADLFYSNFADYILTTTTMRFREIREHHMSEELTEDRSKEKTEA